MVNNNLSFNKDNTVKITLHGLLLKVLVKNTEVKLFNLYYV